MKRAAKTKTRSKKSARPQIGTLAVIGVGLIGGSFALALKRHKAVGRVVGAGRSRANLLAARKLRVIDAIAASAAEAVRGADLVLLAVPPGQMAAVLAEIAPHLGPRAIVTDAGSTKQDVIAAARAALGESFARFVPAHPIAGTENSGAAAAFARLYEGRNVIVTPVAGTEARALRAVSAAWKRCGARVLRMRPDEHDRTYALISHLPHLVSFALVGQLADRPDAQALFGHGGGGLRDMSRIAASSPEMWRDIALANREALLAAMDGYLMEAQTLRGLVASGDGASLAAKFARAGAARRRWLKQPKQPK